MIPKAYKGPGDVALLRTMFLAWIPSDQLQTLAAQMKAKSSSFYTGTTGVPSELAEHVDASFSLNSVPDPNAGSAASGGDSSGSGQAASSSAGQTRKDAIIGVVSALGGVTLVVLVLLIFRSLKRRQEIAHRRLSDPPQGGYLGERPDGQEFDRDSVGGQRRRSFYFAADSLRGAESTIANEDEFSSRAPPVMRQRVAPAAISAPILRDNTMNW